ncbi:hypothetical protein ZIOFF_061318 [Zingiber officinale]|uniref:Uncharacterized protein n=1 Tax=Zingiber officinale TaxID=94328 RepID=A0A8J5F1N3_ZINOF|nr:hypothetical protein ZIOFF_061318 [Zingiber officinale]
MLGMEMIDTKVAWRKLSTSSESCSSSAMQIYGQENMRSTDPFYVFFFQENLKQKGYNLANACSGNRKNGDDGAKKIEVEIGDRCNADSKQEEKQSQLDTMAANKFLFRVSSRTNPMELKPRLRFRKPTEVPLRRPKRTTVFVSIDLDSKKRRRCATWSVQKVTNRCQLVSVVAELKLLTEREAKSAHESFVTYDNRNRGGNRKSQRPDHT